MSIEALRWAFNQNVTGTDKSVLVVLADHADESDTCFPAVKRVAYRAGVTTRSVRRAIDSLEAAGYLRKVTRERSNKSSTSNRYFLNLDHGLQHDPMRGDREVIEEDGVTASAPRRTQRQGGDDTVSPPGGRGVTPNNPQMNPHRKSSSAGASEAAPAGVAGWEEDSKDEAGMLPLDASPAVPARSRKRSESRLPDDWSPTDSHRQKCIEKGLDLGSQVERFRLHAATHDRLAVNWNAAFSMWLSKAAEFQNTSRMNPTSHGSTASWMNPRKA